MDLAGLLVIAGDEEKRRTAEEIRRRDTEIGDLKAAIQALESQRLQSDSDEQERVRPVLDELYAQIVTLQEKMAAHWRHYQSRLVQSRRQTDMAIAKIQDKVSVLEQRNLYASSLFAPIRRLPAEILSEIFLLAFIVSGCSALRLMRVCRFWRLVLLTTPRFWSTIIVRTWTSIDLVEFLLERTGRVTLDVEIDTDSDSGTDVSNPNEPFAALAMVAKTSARWKNLTIHSFPKETDWLNLGVLGTGLAFEGPMSALESFRITGPCEMNTSLIKLIDLVRSSKSPISQLSSFPHVIHSTILLNRPFHISDICNRSKWTLQR